MTQYNEEIEDTRFEKLEAKIDALARHFWKNNVTVGGSSPEEGGNGRHLTDEEIEQALLMRSEQAKARHITRKKILQEMLEQEKHYSQYLKNE